MRRTALLAGAGLCAALACTPGEGEPVCEPEEKNEAPVYPAVHLAPETGWMNDPSGLIRFRDRWHAFFQHNPDAATWGNLHWGHAVSDDLVSWERRDTALAPDDRLGLPFSGSAVVDEDNTSGLCAGEGGCLVLVFTHAFGELGGQKQSLAYSEDGETFTLYADNPVLAKEGDAAIDFRDPHVFWHAPTTSWVMTVSAGEGAEIYTSPNLLDWTFASTVALDGMPEGAWEVPVLFPLVDEATGDERWVFKTDVLPGFAQQGLTRYAVGAFDGETFTADGAPRALEGGPDFYAGMTVAGAGERTLLLGWLSSWAYALDVPTEPYRGFLSTPREARLVDGVLLQAPAAELAAARERCPLIDLTGVTAAEARTAALAVEEYALDVELAVSGASEVELIVRGDGRGQGAAIRWRAADEVLQLDRTAAGEASFDSGFAQRFETPLSPTDGVLRLRVVVDLFSVEVFGGAGEAVLTALVFPRPADQRLALETDGVVERFLVHRLRER